MLDFDTPAVTFKVKGQEYYLDSVTFADAATIASLAEASQAEQIEALARLLVTKARSRRAGWMLWLAGKPSPRRAIESLAAPQQARLFAAWLAEFKNARGVVPGESRASAD